MALPIAVEQVSLLPYFQILSTEMSLQKLMDEATKARNA